MRKTPWAVLGCLLLVSLTACNGPVKFPLEYRPSDDDAASVAAPSGRVRLYVRPVEDMREEKSPLGQTTSEGFKSVPIEASSGSPASFVDEALREEFSKMGVIVVGSPENANRILAVSIRQFSVNESTNYRGRMILVATVLDQANKVRWEQTVTGEDTTHGWSYNPRNYQQVLSDAFVKAFSNLMSTSEFVNALSVTGASGYMLP